MSGIPAKNGKGFNPNPSPFFAGLPLPCIIVNIVKNGEGLGTRLPLSYVPNPDHSLGGLKGHGGSGYETTCWYPRLLVAN